MKKHVHKWMFSASRGYGRSLVSIDRCRVCTEDRERKPTKEERAENREMWDSSKRIHIIHHAFLKRMKDLVGLEAIETAERFAKKHPEEVLFSSVDDDYHAGSDLVFVLHRAKRRFGKRAGEMHYMGATVTYIPQLTREKPISFFLYPSHVEGLRRVLDQLDVAAEEDPERRRERRILAQIFGKSKKRTPARHRT